MKLGIHPQVISIWLSTWEASADAGGARESMQALQGQIKVEVAKYINAHPKDKILLLEIHGEMRAENLELRKSKARPRVRADQRGR